jgi:diacyltrehalose acyltransferase
MKKLLAGAIAAGLVCSAGGLGNGVAAAEGDNNGGAGETSYKVGGAKVPNIPWLEYTYRTGTGYYPNDKQVIVDYPGGQAQGHLLESLFPGMGLDGPSVGESVAIGSDNLDAAVRSDSGPARAVGLSEGTLVLDATQQRLANDPSAPPPDQLSFAMFADPAGSHGFGKSALAALFPPGTFIPLIDYTMPEPVESQYHTTRVVGAYDGLADFPDRPDNLVSLANALFGAGIVHTPVAFTTPANVPPQNIKTTTNSRGGTTTTYLVPSQHLPLTLPLRYLGLPPETVDQIDAVLQPMADAGYSRNDDPSSAPTNVDPVSGMDPLVAMDPTSRGTGDLDAVVNQLRTLLPPGIG